MSMDVHTETTQIHSQKQRNLVNTKIRWWRGRTHTHSYKYTHSHVHAYNDTHTYMHTQSVKKKHWYEERWGAGVETQKNVRGEVGGWDRVSFNEPYAPSLSTIYDGA